MSLRYAWYAFWYAFRSPYLARMLFIAGCGLFLVVGSLLLLMQPKLPDTPRRLEFSQVMELLEKASPQYVSFKADLDFSKKIYYTGWVPYWGRCPPDQVHQLPSADAPASEFRKLAGCRVMVKGSINLNGIYRLTEDAARNEKAAQRKQRILAPLNGAKERISVMSEPWPEGDPRETQWLNKTAFAGVVATYEQAMNELPTNYRRSNSPGARSRPDALVIYDGSDTFSDEKLRERRSTHYWVSVTASGNSIFVWMARGSENNFDGFITGVLQPRERSDYKTRNKGYAQFSVVTGESLPARYGVIQYRTAKEYHDVVIGVGWPMLLFGWIAASVGILGLILYIVAPKLIFEAWKKAFESVR